MELTDTSPLPQNLEYLREPGKIAVRITKASQYRKYLPDNVHLVLRAVSIFVVPLFTFIPKERREAYIQSWADNIKELVASMGDQRKSDA